jgi:hypothetical protein
MIFRYRTAGISEFVNLQDQATPPPTTPARYAYYPFADVDAQVTQCNFSSPVTYQIGLYWDRGRTRRTQFPPLRGVATASDLGYPGHCTVTLGPLTAAQ